ncbi:hypothetical protein KM043_004915 [Ampulex compressa]|nr:hypothetical protein KM043_004915 [Ampulex compressa]
MGKRRRSLKGTIIRVEVRARVDINGRAPERPVPLFSSRAGARAGDLSVGRRASSASIDIGPIGGLPGTPLVFRSGSTEGSAVDEDRRSGGDLSIRAASKDYASCETEGSKENSGRSNRRKSRECIVLYRPRRVERFVSATVK